MILNKLLWKDPLKARHIIIDLVLSKKLKVPAAAKMLNMTPAQVRKLAKP